MHINVQRSAALKSGNRQCAAPLSLWHRARARASDRQRAPDGDVLQLHTPYRR